jgi:guanosine-3',5'-bis(diphosphate) 3'-pyrophosphohydrolase
VGKDIWDKKIKRHKLHFSEDDLLKVIHNARMENIQKFYIEIAEDRLDPDIFIEDIIVRPKTATEDGSKAEDVTGSLFKKFITSARELTSGISILGTNENFLHQYAKCCNPIPGDEIVGFVTIGEGIKVHRKDCKNVISKRMAESERIVEVSWPTSGAADFIAAIRVYGKDRSGLLSDVTHAISSYQNTNIRSVNIDSRASLFEGQIILFVKNTEHLSRVVDKIRRVPGILEVERFFG